MTEIEAHTTATRVVLDVLLERRDTTRPFRMCAVAPEVLVPMARAALVARYRQLVPPDATEADVPTIASTIAPLIRQAAT